MKKMRLCRQDEIADPGSRGFALDELPYASVFVVKKDGQLYAYKNRCPHTGAPLEWKPHQFLDLENSFIQCAMHGALFEIDSGKCLRGPCLGQSLHPEKIDIEQDEIFLVRETDAAS